MKYTCFAALALVVVYILYFVGALAIYDVDGDSVHFQSYLADTLRIFQLLCELVLIVICAHLFEYIPPNPELHVMHRSKFQSLRASQKQASHVKHVQSNSQHDRELIHSALQQQNTVAYTHRPSEDGQQQAGGVIDDARNVLLPDTKVYVCRNDHWVLATVQQFDESVCVVTLDEEQSEQKHERVQIDVTQLSQAQHLKLAIFGINPSWLPAHEDHKYSLKEIPVLLTTLRDLLFRRNGHCQVGILKQKPRPSQYQAFKFAVEQNRAVDSDEFDVHNITQFIKDFYQAIPTEYNCLQTLDFASNDFSHHVHSVQHLKAVLNNKHDKYRLKPNKASKMIMVWLWYLCADILQCSQKNRMSEESLSAAIAPCLYSSISNSRDRNSTLSKTHSNIQSFCALGIKYAVLKYG
eukprot:CAMPEP_0202690428 /NCGR_PEP_ID=MMETSP1385-20130828/5415_1 /ASSEMBLY_ACC=CAM_ASM_000861 /TAXON_ID=933848 /ORGANISM="Elphidium margaritaceum" /LENGTH=407 /DNA_ID=CAMNT_0049345691 /DNA_START=1139 /DNA_END=2362 /DNA_ORIENTATION=-